MKLNDFQWLMLRWSEIAPYNAIHAMQVSGSADNGAWQRAATDAIRAAGLGVPHFQNEEVSFSNVEAVPVETAGELDGLLDTELNRKFSREDLPMRFFTVGGPDGTYYFVVVFDHWLADSHSIRSLMRRIFARYSQAPGDLPPMEFNTRSFREVFPGASRLRAIAELARSYFVHRRAFRAGFTDPLDFRTGFLRLEFPDGIIAKIREGSKAGMGSVNDVFLAALAQAIGQETASIRSVARRREIALAAAVDLRPLAKSPLDDVFGFFLSYFTLVLDKPEARGIAELTRTIASATKPVKTGGHAIRFFTGLSLARILWNLFRKPWAKALLFNKALPVLAGISNVNLTGTWIDQTPDAPGPRVLDYLRVSPTGPLLPLVFTLTTIGGRLSLCVTFRTTATDAARVRRIAEDFAARLASF